MEIWYIVFVGFVSIVFNVEGVYGMSSLVKTYEYFLIPLVQVHSSVPIRKFMSMQEPKDG